MKDNKCSRVLSFFKSHPKFPFGEWDSNYDDYTAMNLMLLNLIKSKNLAVNAKKWSFLHEYNNYRLGDAEGLFYPLGLVNHERQQVLLMGIARKNSEIDGYATMSIYTQKEEFYWHVFKDDILTLSEPFYYATSIYFDPKYDGSGVKLDELLDCYFDENLTLDSLVSFNGSYYDGDFSNVVKDG